MAALVRFGSFVLVVLVLCNNVSVVHGGSSTAAPPTNNSSTVQPPTNGTITIKPTNGSTTSIPITKPGNHSTNGSTTSMPITKPGNHSTNGSTTSVPTMTPGNHTTAVPTKPGNHSTAEPTTHGNHKTPTPEGHNDGHASDRGKWVATGFAIFFVITTVVMTVLYCRQRKIYRELEGDSSLSRLI